MVTRGGSVQLTYHLDEADEVLKRQGLEDGMTLTVYATVTDYHPSVMYTRGGDPGWPAEGGEVEDLVVTSPTGQVLTISPEMDKLLCELVIQEHEQNGGW